MTTDYTSTMLFKGSRWGAKRVLVNMGITPWMANAVLSSAKTFGTHVYPWKVCGYGVGVGYAYTMGLLFPRHTYIVMVSR